MAIFSPKTPEEKEQEEARKIKAVLDRYGLDIDSYSTEDIQKLNAATLKNIARDIAGNKWFKAGMAFSFSKAEEQAKVTYLSALVEQNWILIRQNEAILRKLGQ